MKFYADDAYINPWIPPNPTEGREVFRPEDSIDMDYGFETYQQGIYDRLNAIGENLQLWRKKRTGEICSNPECLNHGAQSGKLYEKCPVCLGTGWVGGYDYYNEILASLSPDENFLEQIQGGKKVLIKTLNWTMAQPELFSGDLLIALDRRELISEKIVQDKMIIRDISASLNGDFDKINDTGTFQIIKISDKLNSTEDYKLGVDYVLSNNGILWNSYGKNPQPFDGYYVTYTATTGYKPMGMIGKVTTRPVRGVIFNQNFEMDFLERGNYLYDLIQVKDPYYSRYPYAFPYSPWYER